MITGLGDLVLGVDHITHVVKMHFLKILLSALEYTVMKIKERFIIN